MSHGAQCYFTVMLWTLLSTRASSSEISSKEPAIVEEYCQYETFHPRCLKNEVILMKSASFGRMRIGRCITAEEVAAFGSDPRYLGCSADVLNILDRKCSGKTECEVRHSDISSENIKPCFPGLIVYLEVNYDCINVVDEERSCSIVVSMQPVHIIGSSESKRICGTQSQPWTLEAPMGQKIHITLLDLTAGAPQSPCQSYGYVVSKTDRKTNVTICAGGRDKEVYSSTDTSTGNTVEVFFKPFEQKESIRTGIQFLLRLEAVGCSDLIPPEDAWLKRSEDSIVIGCYSSRQTWHLHCEAEKWIGVFGNCSQAQEQVIESELKVDSWSDDQVLTMVAVGGLTLTICLAVLCTGIVCLRRFSAKDKKRQDYRTLNFQINSARSQHLNQPTQSSTASGSTGNDPRVLGVHEMPTYSVFVGESDFKDIDNTDHPNGFNDKPCARM